MELCIIEGDGIGHEVVPAALQIIKHVLPDIHTKTAVAGWEVFQETGTSLPQETVDIARSCDAVLFGACSSPSYPVENYFSPIIQLRHALKTFANLRPTHYLPVPTSRAGVDLVVVRENTEGLYIGDEHTADSGESGTATKLITRTASERIAHLAFQLTQQANRKKVTIVHKGNVLPQTDGLFRRVCFEVAESYPELEVDELLVDTAAYWMVKEPTRFDVILTSNLYGDILSDMAAAWGGGLGLAPALNLGSEISVAEPVHGSAPDIVGKGVANPTAAILSAALLIRYHWKMPDVAERIEQAIYNTLHEGNYTADIRPHGNISTEAFTEKVIAHL